jgi:hypothetical protein
MAAQEEGQECRDFSSSSIAGSIASGSSSGFGSLTKKRPALLTSGASSLSVLLACLARWPYFSQDSIIGLYVSNCSLKKRTQALFIPGLCMRSWLNVD